MSILNNTSSALLVIDVQNDFCPGGRLAVNKGDLIIPVINRLSRYFLHVIVTQDWHPREHVSFASNHPGKNAFDSIQIGNEDQVLWPDHCVCGSQGADFHPDLDTLPAQLVIRKGFHREIDSYSAFFENDRQTQTGLDGYLRSLSLDHVFLTGLATDFCVYYTAIDAVRLGYTVTVFEDGVMGINVPNGSLQSAIDTMKKYGVEFIQSGDVLS